ncbi:FxsA family protein [Rhodococcus sp. PAMC28707]|uniref:FxsA family protein n=1 Tax=unclassified Rhodococcus (in: high G+C Gram-positive bacteria) TaxID=192944 RepID=UPI00109E1438|nr:MULTISPECIES: FxsA family protein [unclassified Rhodococcus (in: high G+C Gram-positive bacteria)]QCB51167.1 FxsA family protein [Rhodococcus sp. PAMC28705]QCB57142.1 FxsA family protein [Rhodococcus sp. PAMC28707]
MIALFALYVIVEVAALVAVGSAIGVLWTVLLLIAGSAAGLILVRGQGRRVMEGLRSAGRGERSPGGAVADGVLFAVGSVAMFVPGLVTTAFGILLLLPFTRWALRPLVMLVAARWMPTVATAAGRMRPTVIEGEVVSDAPGRTAHDGPSSGMVLEGQIVDIDGQDFQKPVR